MTRVPLSAWATFLFAATCAIDGEATVLIFDQARNATGAEVVEVSAGATVPQAYGDGVSGSPMNVSGGQFTYGEQGEGFTPNVVVDYFAGAGGPVSLWTTAYGDLENVLYANATSGAPGSLNLRLTADSGYEVLLYGFDLAGWSNADYTIDGVHVSGASGDLFSETDLLVQGNFDGPRHTTFDFATPLSANELLITIDFSNVAAGQQDNIGLDNIRFGQDPAGVQDPDPPGPPLGVPLPSAPLLLGAGLLGLTLVRRCQSRRSCRLLEESRDASVADMS